MVGGIPVPGLRGAVRQVYKGKFVDRFPELPTELAKILGCQIENRRQLLSLSRLCIIGNFSKCGSPCNQAGKLAQIGETAATCLTDIFPQPITPPVVKKFRNTSNPPTGRERIFYGRANDPDIASHLTHGVKSIYSETVASLANPPPKTCFQQKLKEKKESIYLSSREAPLGKSHDQKLRLPKGLDVNNTQFGVTTFREGPGGEVINPPKTFDEVQREAEQGHELYVFTHNDYYVGEPVNRKYDPSTFNRFNLYGKETPHFNDGRNVGRTLHWLHELQMKKSAKIVSKISDDFKEKFQPQLGKVLDPIADTLNVPPDHTFGVLVRPEEYGVGDLLHYRHPSEFLRGKDRERAVFTAIRQNLKKANYQNFDTLLQAFRHYDKESASVLSQCHPVMDWIRANKLKINPDKTKVLLVGQMADQGREIHYLAQQTEVSRTKADLYKAHLNFHKSLKLIERPSFHKAREDGDRKISKEDLAKACFQLNLNLDDELLDALFNYCDLDKDGFINYLEFVNFLNWKDKMSLQEFEEKIITKGKRLGPFDLIPPEGAEGKADDDAILKQEDIVLKEPGSSEKTPRTLSRPTDCVFSDYRTTSSQYNAVVGGIPPSCYPLYGVPSIRADIPAPRFRRISDNTNYGDQASVYALLYPSILSNKGVYERDVFKTRSKEEIARILRNIGVQLSDESFDEVWRQASLKDHRGEVCVESIRNVLDEMQASYIKSR